MRALTLIFTLVVALTGKLNAQVKFTSGDIELDKSMFAITKYSRGSMAEFQNAIIGKYELSQENAVKYTNKLAGGDLIMVFETSKALNKPVDEVMNLLIANRMKKGWDDILKQLGCKYNSKSFNLIKDKVINNGII